MVDPDNRRPVDYGLRQQLMHTGQTAPLTLEDWRNGACKQQVIRTLLHFRCGREDLFTIGDYVPLTVTGALADKLIAFARRSGGLTVVVLVSRHAARLIVHGHSAQTLHAATPLIPPQRWGDTAVQLPDGIPAGEWQSVLSGAEGAVREQRIIAADVLRTLPVDVLVFSA